MVESKNNLEDIVNLLDLKSKGVEVLIGDPGRINAGVYAYLSCRITIRKEVVPYWFATFTTVLHESAHHRQRPLIITSLIVFTSILIGDMLYGFLSPEFNTLIRVAIWASVSIITYFFKFHYLEDDADRYMIRHIPRFLILLSDLEFIEIAESGLWGEKWLKQYLKTLYKEMLNHHPELLDYTKLQ